MLISPLFRISAMIQPYSCTVGTLSSYAQLDRVLTRCAGLQVTQRWTVPGAAGPAPRDLTTVAHTYSSTVNPVSDYYSGLIGISMITTAGQLLSDGQVRNFSGPRHCPECESESRVLNILRNLSVWLAHM